MNLIFLIYREVHYRVVQKNPMLMNNPVRYQQALKNALSVRRGLGLQFFNYLFLGVFSALSIAFTNEKDIISSFSVFLSVIPFVFSIYITAIQGSNVVYSGVFEPLKVLPVKMGSRYLSAYLLLEISPSVAMVIPTAIIIMVKYPLSGVIALLWFLMGIFLGHVFGLIILTFFGLKVRQSAGKKELVTNIIRAISFFMFMGILYAFVYMQKYIKEHSEEWASLIGKYFMIYPFSVGTMFKPTYSVIILLLYALILFLLYYLFLGMIWKRIMEPLIAGEGKKITTYKITGMGRVRALLVKDFKILIRRIALLAGFMIIVYIVFPQLFVALSNGSFPLKETAVLLFMVGIFAATGTDAILKIDIKSIEFLRSLPLRKRDFVFSKVLAMCIVPWGMGLVMILISLYYNGIKALVLIPYAVVLPFISSSVAMLYYFHYREEEIGIPDLRWGDMIILLLIIGASMLPAAVPVIFNMYILGELIALVEFFVILYLLRK